MAAPPTYEKAVAPASPIDQPVDALAAGQKEKNLPPPAGTIIDGHHELSEGHGGGALAVLKGDVSRQLTTFERKAALINA